MIAKMQKGRLDFQYKNASGAEIQLSVLETGEAGVFHKVGDSDWEHVTDKVFTHTECGNGLTLKDPQDLARVMNTVHLSLVSGPLSELKPWQSSSPVA